MAGEGILGLRIKNTAIMRNQLEILLRNILTYGGWVIAIILCTLMLLLQPRLHLKILEQPTDWNKVLTVRQNTIASFDWKDERPLTILLGDSHIEFGDWYNLFNGSLAVRNCGLSMATITDVTELEQVVPDKDPRTVVLFCGINNLLREQSVSSALRDYEALLNQTIGRFPNSIILVLRVLQVRRDLLGTRTRQINDRVKAFNEGLQRMCQNRGIRCFPTSEGLLDASGGLDSRFTNDGLHLNRCGYQILVSELIKPIAECEKLRHE